MDGEPESDAELEEDEHDFVYAKMVKDKANRLMGDGKITAAITRYYEALDLCPPHEKEWMSRIHNNLGIALKKLKKPDEAIQEFSKAIDLNPTYEKPLVQRMTLYKEAKKFHLAQADGKRIAKINPDFGKPQEDLFTRFAKRFDEGR